MGGMGSQGTIRPPGSQGPGRLHAHMHSRPVPVSTPPHERTPTSMHSFLLPALPWASCGEGGFIMLCKAHRVGLLAYSRLSSNPTWLL